VEKRGSYLIKGWRPLVSVIYHENTDSRITLSLSQGNCIREN